MLESGKGDEGPKTRQKPGAPNVYEWNGTPLAHARSTKTLQRNCYTRQGSTAGRVGLGSREGIEDASALQSAQMRRWLVLAPPSDLPSAHPRANPVRPANRNGGVCQQLARVLWGGRTKRAQVRNGASPRLGIGHCSDDGKKGHAVRG